MTSITDRLALFTTVVASTICVDTASATTEVANASAALSFWMTWGLVYLAIGVVLMAVATATAVREGRAWSSLLSWTADYCDEGDEDDAQSSRRAA